MLEAPVAIGTFAPPSGEPGVAYYYEFAILFSGQIDSYGISGTLPAGLNVNTTLGVITGIPESEGTTTGLAATATNAAGTATTNTASLVIETPIAAPIASGTFNPPDGTVGTFYYYPFSDLFTGGAVDTYTVNGTLPDGIVLQGSALGGIPTSDATFSGLSVTGTNTTGSDTTNTADITIAAEAGGPIGTEITQAMVPYEISATGAYYVAENLTSATTAITIAASNVSLDLNKKLITFNTGNNATTHGIGYSGAPANVTISNGYIEHAGTTDTYCKGILPRGDSWLIENVAIRDGNNGVFTGIGNNESRYL